MIEIEKELSLAKTLFEIENTLRHNDMNLEEKINCMMNIIGYDEKSKEMLLDQWEIDDNEKKIKLYNNLKVHILLGEKYEKGKNIEKFIDCFDYDLIGIWKTNKILCGTHTKGTLEIGINYIKVKGYDSNSTTGVNPYFYEIPNEVTVKAIDIKKEKKIYLKEDIYWIYKYKKYIEKEILLLKSVEGKSEILEKESSF